MREEVDLLQCVEGVCVLAVPSRTCAAAVFLFDRSKLSTVELHA